MKKRFPELFKLVNNPLSKNFKVLITGVLKSSNPTIDDMHSIAFGYQKTLDEIVRKSGTHYTDPKVAYYLAKHALDPVLENLEGLKGIDQSDPNHQPIRIADIACGSGIIVFAVIQYMVERGYDQKWVIDNCLYCSDLDRGAIDVLRFCLWLLTGRDGSSLALINKRVVYGDSLVGRLTKPVNGLFGPIPYKCPSTTPIHWFDLFPEVFDHKSIEDRGFEVIVGNPPFLGRSRLLSFLGRDYTDWINKEYQTQTVDLVVYFFLRTYQLLKPNGIFGLISTNSVAEGKNKEEGLDRLIREGLTIYRANKTAPWVGECAVSISFVWAKKGLWDKEYVVEGNVVGSIGGDLLAKETSGFNPKYLKTNEKKSFLGCSATGIGFTLDEEEVKELLFCSKKNNDVAIPYIDGKDLVSNVEIKVHRYIINFRGWPLSRESRGCWRTGNPTDRKEWLKTGVVPGDYPDPVASDYPDCLEMVQRRVTASAKANNCNWWQFMRPTPRFYDDVYKKPYVFARSRVGKHNILVPVTPSEFGFSVALMLFNVGWPEFSCMVSDIHWVWALKTGGSLYDRPRYQNVCFSTFPFPSISDASTLTNLGKEYDRARKETMLALNIGPTKLYNKIYDKANNSGGVNRLRDLRRTIDTTVLSSYGWDDLNLDHGFYHRVKGGSYFGISPSSETAVLGRLLALNQETCAKQKNLNLDEVFNI